MAIRYFRKRVKVHINGETLEKYIASMQRETTVGLDDIAEIVERNSTLSKGDLVNAFYQMVDIAEMFLLSGHKFNCGVLGSFSPSINAKACDRPEEITTKTIKRFYVIFKPSRYLKQKLKEVEFRLGDNRVREVKYRRQKEKNIL